MAVVRRASFALVLALLLAAGFSRGETSASAAVTGSAPIPVKEYVARADRLCLSVAKEVLALKLQQRLAAVQAKGGSERTRMRATANLLGEQLAAVSRFERRLAALPLPRGEERFGRRVRAAITQSAILLRAGVAALRAGEARRAERALLGYRDASLRSARLARDHGGFRYCGSGA